MRHFKHSFCVKADISKVWEFYRDLKHLEVITPPELDLRVVKATHQKLEEGSEVWLTGKLVTRSHWHSKITSLRPHVYVDEMISGRFRLWRHTHQFQSLNNGTEVIDEIDFELHYGLVGRMFEGYVMRKLENVFAHRELATKTELDGKA